MSLVSIGERHKMLLSWQCEEPHVHDREGGGGGTGYEEALFVICRNCNILHTSVAPPAFIPPAVQDLGHDLFPSQNPRNHSC